MHTYTVEITAEELETLPQYELTCRLLEAIGRREVYFDNPGSIKVMDPNTKKRLALINGGMYLGSPYAYDSDPNGRSWKGLYDYLEANKPADRPKPRRRRSALPANFKRKLKKRQ